MTIRASELEIGQVAKIEKIKFQNLTLKNRLLDFGLTVGTKMKVLRVAPLGEPKVILVRGSEIIIRKEELKNIIVEV